MARTRAQKDTEQQITNEIIDLIENGMVDGKWQRPWSLVGFMPYNALTGKQYRGINMLIGMIHGGGAFATYKQWQELGGQVRGGQKGAHMFRPMKLDRKDAQGNVMVDANGDAQQFMMFKAFSVFQQSQQDGWAPEQAEDGQQFEDVAAAEAAIAASGAKITEGGSDRAFYSPGADSIQLPAREQFDTAAGFYGTALHELVHWTGHSSRLDRDLNTGRFGDEAYAFEELVAELGATFLCAHFGIEQEADHNHVKYVKSWVKILQNDKKAIRDAASLAQKAVDYILGAMEGEAQDGEDVKAAA